ncbi:phytase [Dendrothele bispora CBS 962.96]|uniref:Phytase A n=1 Tax=Dendrothele bispora (strain CBS 962.96) TaxID=1314807 RepID=A0A4S8M4W5_DENBC|nr:phytase [Dendrothele bispora CBS 962.96]
MFLWTSVAVYLWATSAAGAGIGIRETRTDSELGNEGQERFKLEHSWAQYSPFFPVEDYASPPEGCTVDQVNIIQRHGARFPTSGASTDIISAVNKLKAVQNSVVNPKMQFIQNYTYDLGTDDLVEFGAVQSSEAGSKAFERYEHLVSEDNLPFVRSDNSERVVLSAINWTQGFSIASHFEFKPVLSVIISSDTNDTLDDNMCPAAGSSDAETEAWLLAFGPSVQRKLNNGAPGANLTLPETYAIGTLCAFDSVAHSSHPRLTLSPWCGLFNQTDFEALEYAGDLDKFYGTGYGQPLGPVQGVGYVNELLARLTDQPVRDHTQTNSTLDSNPDTFPLGRGIYADFSHDNQMIAIFSAMGLFPQSSPLPPVPPANRPDPTRTWIVSQIVPFSARMVAERLSCSSSYASKQAVRILVNDKVMPLEFCGASEDGVCELDKFVESQVYARNDGEGDFEKCFDV